MPSPNFFPTPYIYSKRKGGQVRFTPNQTDILEKRFMSNKYLSPEDRKSLADNLKLSDRQVKKVSRISVNCHLNLTKLVRFNTVGNLDN